MKSRNYKSKDKMTCYKKIIGYYIRVGKVIIIKNNNL